MSSSPIPRREPAYLDLGRGLKWYVIEDERYDVVRGGPFASEAEAQSAIGRWVEELHAEYEAVEREAREGGWTVTWSPGAY